MGQTQCGSVFTASLVPQVARQSKPRPAPMPIPSWPTAVPAPQTTHHLVCAGWAWLAWPSPGTLHWQVDYILYPVAPRLPIRSLNPLTLPSTRSLVQITIFASFFSHTASRLLAQYHPPLQPRRKPPPPPPPLQTHFSTPAVLQMGITTLVLSRRPCLLPQL